MCHPLVTVVIPIYNVEDYIDRCISSVVNQTYNNLEIILVNDGSLDRCPQICEQWSKKDSRIKVIHKTNEGLGFARNTGIDNASGKYIFFFDGDDFVDNEIVRKCVESAQTYNSDVVLYGYFDAYSDGTVKAYKTYSPKKIYINDEITNQLLYSLYTYQMGFGTSCCMKMFNLDTLRSIPVRFKSERDLISEDAFFVLEYFSSINIASVINENLYYYYKRSGSLTTSFRLDRQYQNNVFLSKSFEFFEANQTPFIVRNGITMRYHMYTISAIKHLINSDLTSKEKNNELFKILKDDFLHKTLKTDVINSHKQTLRLFFWLIKLRQYWLCYILIYIKISK